VVIRRAPAFGPHIEEAGQRAAHLARRFQWTLGMAAVVGVCTGLAVAAFDSAVAPVLELVLDQGLLLVTVVPAAGLLAVGVLGLRWSSNDSATTDAYVRAYHQRDGRLDLRSLWTKLTTSAITLASGNAFGFEGPSILLGATIGSNAERSLFVVKREVGGVDGRVEVARGAGPRVGVGFVSGPGLTCPKCRCSGFSRPRWM
jgi:H+/Cl- antiporter ClcA